jgi:hypothetical protein
MKVKEYHESTVPRDISVKNEYFAWLVNKVQLDDNHWCLMRRLHQKDFYWLNSAPRDENRAQDGTDLRAKFANDSEWSESEVLEILAGPCSCLELLVALAMRIEEDVMYTPEDGDRTKTWFKIMLENIDLLRMNDDDYYQPFVDNVLESIMARRYKKNSKGSLFPVRHTHGKDWRTTELWMQMQLYFDENVLP